MRKVRQALESGIAETRGRAMQALLQEVRKDRSLHDAALPIFEEWVLKAPDAWTALSAARGIEILRGEEEGRRVWRSLMSDPRPEIAAAAVMAVADPWYVPFLIDLMNEPIPSKVRSVLIRKLGQLKDHAVLPHLLPYLTNPEFLGDALQAIADLGDPRAVPELERLLENRTELWREDNHGPMIRAGDLARETIARLRGAAP